MLALVSVIGVTAITHLGAQTATQTVSFRVIAQSRLDIATSPAPLFVRSATARNVPTSASVSGTTWAITTNEANQKVVGAIDSPMPAGLSLAVSLGAPAGAASRGSAALGVASVDLVTGLSSVSASALPMVYTLNSSASASALASGGGTRRVTYTITSGQ